MNVYDSERMLETISATHDLVNDPNEADAILLNTCHIREKAAEKVYSEIGKFSDLKNKNKKLKVVVAGCVAQAEGKAMLQRQPLIDSIIGPQMYQNLSKVLLYESNNKNVLLDFKEEEKFSKLGTKRNTSSISSFITIQEGCDKFCSFCVVPFTRGAEYSRSVEEIVDEAKSLCEKGCKEIILLGQNVNAYHGINKNKVQINLAGLITELAKITKLERITYTTSHPRDMNDDLINLHQDNEKLNPYLHLPVQSGSDSILKNMNRKYTVKQYLKIIDKLRKKVPNIALSSDFIVGFPGETKKDFQETLNLVKEVKFAQAYSFKYSRRIGTRANRIKCALAEKEKDERLHELQAILNNQKIQYNQSFLGKKVEVLIKGKGKKEKQYRGTTKWMQSAIFEYDGYLERNKVNLKVKSAMDNCLLGDLI